MPPAAILFVFVCLVARECAANTVCGITPSTAMISTTTNGTHRNIEATGCPGYDWTMQTGPNLAQVQCHSFSIPLFPTINSDTNHFYVGVFYDVNMTQPVPPESAFLGIIGITTIGVALFGNGNAKHKDAFMHESMIWDDCDGHIQKQNIYHYHTNPKPGCVYNDTEGQHSPLLGFMADGIPIYGMYGDNGTLPTDLDDCGGHTDNTHSFYHYHSTNYTYPYLVNCLRGCLNGSNMLQSLNPNIEIPECVPNTTQYDYSSLESVWQPMLDYNCSTGSSAVSTFIVSFSHFGLVSLLLAFTTFCLDAQFV